MSSRASIAVGMCLLLVGCGSEEPRSNPAAAVTLTRDVAALERRIEALEGAAAETRSSSRKAARRLWEALGRLRRELADSSAGVGKATAAAREALAEAQAAARSLAVLTDRFDYHLRRYHSGD